MTLKKTAPFFEGKTLEEAKQFIEDNLELGVGCPCCGRFAKKYRFPFNSSMANVLIEMYKAEQKGLCDLQGYIHVENYLVEIGNKVKGSHGKMRHWGLVERMPNTDETKHHSGLWRLTAEGRLFVQGVWTVSKYAYLFDDKVHGFDGEYINISDALGYGFNFTELMLS